MPTASQWFCCLELFSQKLNLSVTKFIFMSTFVLLCEELASKVIAEKVEDCSSHLILLSMIPEPPLRVCVCVLLLVQLLCSWLHRGAALRQEAVEGRITLAWIQSSLTQGTQPPTSNQADISTLVIVGCYSSAASVTRQNLEGQTETNRCNHHPEVGHTHVHILLLFSSHPQRLDVDIRKQFSKNP